MEKEGRQSRNSLEGLFLALILFLLVTVAVWAAARKWLPPLASEHGAGIDLMIHYLLVTVGSLFVAGHVALGYFVWRFSRQDQVTCRLLSPKAEKIWSLIPVVLMALVAEGGIFVLGLPVWGKLYASATPPEAVTVEVTGEQFAWNFRYPGPDGIFGRTAPQLISEQNPLGRDTRDPAAKDDVVQPGELYAPVNKPLHLRLRSRDTLHSFFLPNLRIKQDAVPGMTIDIWFVPTQVGDFEIACAELCGLGHYQMRGLLRIVSQEKFESWLKEQ